MDGARIQRAALSDEAALAAVLRQASLANVGDRAFLMAHPEVMVIDRDLLGTGRIELLAADGEVAGFVALLSPVDGRSELDGIFVTPSQTRRGFGRQLMEAACARARAEGAHTLHALVNPHALAFYEALGFGWAPESAASRPPEVQAGLALALQRSL